MNNQNPQSSFKGILSIARFENSRIPSRIKGPEVKNFPRSGTVELEFYFEKKHYTYVVPFLRPFTSEAKGTFANLLNLNSSESPTFNQSFSEFEKKLNKDFTSNKLVEIEITYSMKTPSESEKIQGKKDQPEKKTAPVRLTPTNSIIKEISATEMVHIVCFALQTTNSVAKTTLRQFNFTDFQIANFITRVNNQNPYECGTMAGNQNPFPLTLIPLFRPKTSVNDYLSAITRDVVQAHETYFKKHDLHLVLYSEGCGDVDAFLKNWMRIIQTLRERNPDLIATMDVE